MTNDIKNFLRKAEKSLDQNRVEEARSWLTHVEENEVTLFQMCRVAELYFKLGDEKKTRSLLSKQILSLSKEEYIGGLARSWIAIACIYHDSLKDRGSAETCLEKAFHQTWDVHDLILLAKQWKSWELHNNNVSDYVLRCFEELIELVETASDCIYIFEAFTDLGLSKSKTLYFLELAQQLSQGNHRKIHGYLRTTENPPKNVYLPNKIYELIPKTRKLVNWENSSSSLYVYLLSKAPNIQGISEADYGYDAKSCETQLHSIIKSEIFPDEISYPLIEVLTLTGWISDLDGVFANTLLCLIGLDPTRSHEFSMEARIPLMIKSCIDLGSEAMTHLSSFFVCMIEAEYEKRFAMFGLLLVASYLDKNDQRLEILCKTLVEEEKIRNSHPSPGDRWLLGTTYFNQNDDLWIELSHTLLGDSGCKHLEDIDRRLGLV